MYKMIWTDETDTDREVYGTSNTIYELFDLFMTTADLPWYNFRIYDENGVCENPAVGSDK